MAVFSAIAATFNYLVYTGIVLVGSGGAAALFAIQAGAALITGALVYGVGRGVSKALMPDIPSGNIGANGGTRVQLSPSPSYSVPVVYGHAFQNGIVTDAAITSDNQTMTYVLTLGEKTSGTTTLGDIFWNDKKLEFASSTSPEVVRTIDEDGTVSTDYANNVEVYIWDDTTELRGDGSDPHTLVSHWDSSDRNSGTLFAIVKVTFDPEAQLTGLGTITVEMTNSLDNPADVIQDYLTNTVYGCGIPLADIDTTTLATLETYSDELIDYTDNQGASATQKRYTMNGIVNTSEDCRTVIDRLLTACNSFFTFNAKSGKWKVTPNRAETTTNINTAFVFNDDNILGELKFSTTALDGAFNSIEIEFPDKDQKDKNNYVTIDLPANLREANEPDNQMSLRMEFVNNNVQAEYLANQQLRQTRDDLVVMFTADYSALQVDAGDIIKLYETQIYGQNNKLYRVMKCVEKETDDGMITVDITAVEYNSDVYTVEPITEFTPADNSDIGLFNRLGQASTPIVDNERSLLSLPVFDVNTNTPSSGIYDRAELHYADNSSFNNSQLLLTKTTPSTFGNGTEVEFTVRGLPSGTYYYRTRVGNEQAYGAFSSTSSAHNWTANVQINPVTIIDSSDPTFTVNGLNIEMIPQSISNTYLSPGVVSALGAAGNIVIPEVAGYFYFTASGNTTAPTTSAFNTQVGRDPIENDIVIVTNTVNDDQTSYIHNGTSFVAQTNFFSGGLVTDGTLGANKIVANSIDTTKLTFTPVQSVAGVSGASISTAQLSTNGLQLTTDVINTSRLNGTVGETQGGTGRTSITSYVADLKANGLRLTADTVDTGLLTGSAIPESLGGTGVTTRSAMYSADGVRLDSQTVPFADVTGTVPENQGGTGTTSLSAMFTAEGVRLNSQTVPFSSVTGTVPEGQGGTGATSFSSALTAQGVGFVSGSNANLGDLATLDNITLAKVTDSGTLAGLNNAVLGTNTSGTLPEGQGGTGHTSDSAYASHLSSQGLIVTSIEGNTGAISAATLISAGSLAVIGQDISDFNNDTGFTTGAGVNANVTSISGGVITTGTLDASVVNVTNLNATNITSGQITADRIDVTDLALEVTHDTVTGATIGYWNNGAGRLKRVGAIGTEPGIYTGYVRVFGGSGQVKNLSIVIGDGTFGAGSFYQLRNDFDYDEGTVNGTSNSVPISTTGYAQYVSGGSKFWCKIDRFNSIYAIAQQTIMFRKTSSNSTTTYLYIEAEGDGNFRYLTNVEYAFYRFTEI
jgi:hypothetical protein